MADVVERELGWDDVIENDGPQYALLPKGEYDFEVISFERGHHPGSEKLPPCNKATVKIRVEGAEGVALIDHNLYLHTKTEGILCSFFSSIGQRQHGERLTMNWSTVPGSRGRCSVYIDEWTDKDNKPRQNNKISKFLDPPKKAQTSFKAGEF